MDTVASLRPRYEETDQMGVVYHSNYIVWFEVGRSTFFRALGFPYKEMEEKNVILPVSHVHCDYKLPAYYDEEIEVHTKVMAFTGVRLRLAYEVKRKETGELLALGETHHAFTDKSLRVVNVKKKLPALAGLLKNLMEEMG